MNGSKTPIKLEYLSFSSEPINSFRLPDLDLSFRGDSSHARECEPDDFASYDVKLESDEYFEQYLLFQTIDDPCLYLRLAEMEFDAQSSNIKHSGGFVVRVKIIRMQNIEGISDLRDSSQLQAFQQFIFDKEYSADEALGPNFHWISVGPQSYLAENASLKNSDPRHIFFRPIDHRHALMIDATFEGFLPMGTPFPPELHEACMDVIKDFLSHIELSPRD